MTLRIRNSKGFTLIEILMVIALTVMIMGLVFVPLVQSFNITRRAEVMVRVQDNARLALSRISRDLANAMYVYDNTRDSVNFPVVRVDGTPTVVQVRYAKVDLVLPRMRAYCPLDPLHTPGGLPRGAEACVEAAPVCRYSDGGTICGAPLELKPIEPICPDTRIVRYFIGLRDPTRWYANGYERKLAEAGGDNLYVLYRAEFSPLEGLGGRRLFKNADAEHLNENLSDQNFFYNQEPNGYPGGETYAEAWRKISEPIVTLIDTDLITIEYDGDGNPIVTPTVRFTPTAIYNDPLVPTTEADDDPEHSNTAPTVYKATYGQWVLPYEVTLQRANQDGSTTVYKTRVIPGTPEIGIYRLGEPDPIFNITWYERAKLDPAYAGSVYGIGEITPARPELAFTVDTLKGAVDFAFPMVNVTYCDTVNATLNLGGKIALSTVANSADINAAYSQADPYRRLLLNWSGAGEIVLGNATVVPGSVKVIAPDTTPGASYGTLVPYTRLPFLSHDPGRNQFTVDVEHGNPDPLAAGTAAIYFDASQPAQVATLPEGTNNVLVYYEAQNNMKGDNLRANYVTKSVMTVILGIRIYDPTSGKPQAIQLTNKIRLRNVAT